MVAWNLMDGRVDWAGFEPIAALLGVADVEGLIRGVVAIRDHQAAKREG